MGFLKSFGFTTRKEKSLKETGIELQGAVKDVVFNNSVVINGRAQRRIVVVAMTPDGVSRYFESGNVSYMVGPEIVGQPVSVYVDPENYDNFYVDISQYKHKGTIPVATIRF